MPAHQHYNKPNTEHSGRAQIPTAPAKSRPVQLTASGSSPRGNGSEPAPRGTGGSGDLPRAEAAYARSAARTERACSESIHISQRPDADERAS